MCEKNRSVGQVFIRPETTSYQVLKKMGIGSYTMAIRSSFLCSISLVLVIALCFTAAGGVQAFPDSINTIQKPAAITAAHSSLVAPISARHVPDTIIQVKDYRSASTGFLKAGGFPIEKGPAGTGVSTMNRAPLTGSWKDRFEQHMALNSPVVRGAGTVVYMDLEGGFWGLFADDGSHYIPGNLPQSCKVDGLRVKFYGREGIILPNIRMWGTPFHILSITPLGDEIAQSGTVEFIDLEGGFYGIIATGGEHYLPLNLPEAFMVDGLKVTFTARTAPDTNTIYMWGTPVTILSIEKQNGNGQEQIASLIGQWTLIGLAKGGAITPVIQGSMITATFSSDGRVGGTSGCNLYSAEFESDGKSISIGRTLCTLMYCVDTPRGIMKQESTYLQYLNEAASWTIRGEDLVISDKFGRELLVFSPGIADMADTEEPLVEFWRTGGFAGMDDHLVILDDGSATLSRKEYTTSFSLPESALADLVTLFEQSGFINCASQYTAPTGSADLFIYQISWEGKTVVVEDTAIPEGLQEIIDVLTSLVQENGPDDVIPPANQ